MGASSLLSGSGGEAGAGHALAQSALLEKVLFETAELLVEQVGGHFDESSNDIAADGRVGMFDALPEGLVICAGGCG